MKGAIGMQLNDKHQAFYDDLCKALGRAVVLLKESGQPVTEQTLDLMLQNHNTQTEDLYLTKIYTTARRIIR
jgi:hypothetical protein